MIPWDDSSSKKAKDHVWRKLGGPVFLDSSNQVRDFPLFLGEKLKFNYITNMIIIYFINFGQSFKI